MAFKQFGDDVEEGTYLVKAGWIYDHNYNRWKRMDSTGIRVMQTDMGDEWKQLVKDYADIKKKGSGNTPTQRKREKAGDTSTLEGRIDVAEDR